MPDRLTNERFVELAARHVIEIRSAQVSRRYWIGPFEGALLEGVEPTGASPIEAAFVVLDPSSDCLVVASWIEQNRLASFTGASPRRLVTLHEGRRTLGDARTAAADTDGFERDALARAEELTGHKHSRDASKPLSTRSKRPRRRAELEAPASSEPPASSLRRVARRAYRSRAFRPLAAGVGGATILFAIAKLGLKVVLHGATHATPAPVDLPPVLRADAPAPSGGRGDRLHGKDETLDPIAADATAVYWVSRSEERLYRESVDDGEPRMLASGLFNPTGITVDDSSVYVTTATGRHRDRNATLFRIPKSGGTPAALASAMLSTAAPRVHEGYVYFLEGLVFEDIGRHEKEAALTKITRAPIAGGSTDYYLWDGEIQPALAVTETRVLWLPWNDAAIHVGPIGKRGLRAPEPFVIRLPDVGPSSTDDEGGLDAGTLERATPSRERPLASAAPRSRHRVPVALTAAEETIFVTTSAPGLGSIVYRLPFEGETPELWLVGRGDVRDLTADGADLYWIEEGHEPFDVTLCGALPAATVVAERASPCAESAHAELETFALAEHLPRGAHLAVGGGYLYWTTGAGVAYVRKDAGPASPAGRPGDPSSPLSTKTSASSDP